MATIITKNSSTPSSVPTAGDLEQGELAVNVADKRLFTENSTGSVVELGTNPSSLTTSTVDIDGGTIDGAVIGGTTPAAVSGTTGTFSGALSATSGTFTAGIISNFAFPQWNLIQDTAPADEGRYRIIGIGEQLRIQTLSDAGAVGGNAYAISRSGTDITSITYGNAADNPDHIMYGSLCVGDGAETPLEPLHIKAATAQIRFEVTGGTAYGRIRASNVGTLIYGADPGNTATGSAHVFQADNAEILRANASGISLDGGSNYLDTVESGTFTPALAFGGNSVGITYDTQSGTYLKINNTVFFEILVDLSNKGSSSGTAQITNLPFTAAAGINAPCSIDVALVSFADFLAPAVNAGFAVITLYEISNAGTRTTLDDTNFTNSSVVVLSGHYEAA